MDEIVIALAQLVRHLAVGKVIEVRNMKNTSMNVQTKFKYAQEETELLELVRRLHFAELTVGDRKKRAKTDKIGGTD